MRIPLLAVSTVSASLLCGCLNFPEEGAYRCAGAPRPGCTDECFCPDDATPPVNEQISAIFGARYGQDVWVVGMNGKLWRRREGTWTQQASFSRSLYNGWGREPDGVLVAGADGFLAESAADAPVEVVTTGTTMDLAAAWSWGTTEGWAVGEAGTMLRRGEAGWAIYPSSPATNHLYAVHGYYPENVWTVGEGGKAYHWNSTTWIERSPPLTARLNAVWVSITGDVWVAGAGGVSARYREGDSSWTVIPAAPVDLVSLSGANPDDVWAGGAAGSIFHLEDGAWVQANNLSTESLPTYGLWAFYAGDLWAGSGTTVERRRP